MTQTDQGMSRNSGSVNVVVRQLDSDAILVAAAGEVDLRTHGDVKSALFDALAPPSPMVLIADFSRVSFFDSCGISTVVETHQRAQTVGTDFRIVGTHRAVRLPLTITGVDRYLDLYDDRESAYQQPNPMPLTST
ncbi:MAG: anti-sigma factor antagonist [Actinophytocola sp.]|nr:anti-sigma factor antagonist [Actinophytocola sp.]